MDNHQITVKDNRSLDQALSRCTHMAIGAHPDDIELLGLHGILACKDSSDHHFLGVVVTSGSGSARQGPYADMSDEQLVKLRSEEQKKAALLGDYEVLVELQMSSQLVKSGDEILATTVAELLAGSNVQTIYTHNPFDRHATHLAVLKQVMNVNYTHIIETTFLVQSREFHSCGKGLLYIALSISWATRMTGSSLIIGRRFTMSCESKGKT